MNPKLINPCGWGLHSLCALSLLFALIASADRPNIVFLLTDDQRDNTFAAMGHPFVNTPNVDRLLSKSVRFKNTYTAEPVCSPSRVSLLVGMHERVHGIGFTSAYDMTEEQWERSYPALLQKAGYFTGFVGKIGIEYYTWKGNAGDKFDYWWGHDGWTKFLPKNFDSPSTSPYHKAKKNIITEIMGEALGDRESIHQYLSSAFSQNVFDPNDAIASVIGLVLMFGLFLRFGIIEKSGSAV